MKNLNNTTLKGVQDVVSYIDANAGIRGRAGIIWWLALGGLFLDAFANSALSVGLGPMTRDLKLDAGQIGLMTSFASWIAIAFNPIGGWIADRWGRMRPLIFAKLLALAGAVFVTIAQSYDVILLGRFFAGAAYGIDFAIAMAVLAEFTPAHLRSRINTWQGIWYTAVCTNVLLAMMFYSWNVGDEIWRYAIGATGVFAFIIMVLQAIFMIESPTWFARKERLDDAARVMSRIYQAHFIAAPLQERLPVLNQARRGILNTALIFRGVYLPRTILAGTVQVAQSIEYFAVGWYLPIISTALFGKNFIHAMIGTLVFNIFGVIGGYSSPAIGRALGLRKASAIGFGAVFVMLLIMGLFHDSMPIWIAVIVPSLFILFHSGGPGANGKSLSSLSFRSELRAGANGVIGALGAIGAALGLLVFPILRADYGLGKTFLVLSLVPLAACIICSIIKWDPTRAATSPDEELNVPQFADSK